MCRRRLRRRRHAPSAVPAGSGGGRRHGGMEVYASSVRLGPMRASRGHMGNVAAHSAPERAPVRAAVTGRRPPVIRMYSDRREAPPANLSVSMARVTMCCVGVPGADGGTVGSARHGGG